MFNLIARLFETTVSMSIVILLLLLISPFFDKKYSYRLKYFIWLFIAIMLIVPFSIATNEPAVKISVPDQYSINVPATGRDKMETASAIPEMSGNVAGNTKIPIVNIIFSYG